MKKIWTESLDAGYGRKLVLRNVNVEAKPGEILALMGPNGAGKSTLLKTITAQLQKQGGVVVLDGKELTEIPEGQRAKQMALVTTHRPRPEWMTCREMVATGRYPYTGRLGILSQEDWEKTEEALRIVQGEDIAEADFNQISDGQRQRIMLARAICQEPEVLVLDEPTSFLDVQFKLDILGTLRRIAREKDITVILSLHELEFIPAVADRVLCVSGEGMTRIGTPEDVMTGEVLEELFHLPTGAGSDMADGIRTYAKALQKWMR